MSYLEEAAGHLKQVADDLDKSPDVAPANRRSDRLRIAEGYIALAAIERGLPPGCPAHRGHGESGTADAGT